MNIAMAEEIVEKVDEQLNCTICLDTYTDPKILQCFHVYCQKCLVKLVVRDQQRQLSLSCPICRQVTPVPASGTAGLQSAFHINPLLEILDQHKKAKAESASIERADSKAESLSSQSNSAFSCSEHGGREVELFCETCQKLLCMKCVIKGGKHFGHDYRDISESFERYREQVTLSLEPLEKQLTTSAEVLTQVDRHCEKITDQQAIIKANIRASSKRLQELISKRQDFLIGQLEQETRRKLKRLATQRNQIETRQAQLSSCLEFMRESLKTSIDQREVLIMKSGILKQVGELTPASQPDIFTLSTAADMVFSASADAAAVCENYGRVYASNSPNPSKCVATGRGTEEAVVGEKATAVLHAVSFKGEPCSDASEAVSFQVELVSEITGDKLVGSIEHSMVSYQPIVKGRHQLHIKADGQHIRGSPFSVTVTLPVEKLGTPILTLSHLGEPWGIAVTWKGEVVVVESGAHCVSVFSPRGEKLGSFGTRGSGEGQFWSPSGVAVDGEGNLLVTDRNKHRIQKFTAEGHFLKAVGSWGSETQQFNEPCDIAYSASNNKVYVADMLNHRVQVLNSDLSSSSMFGRRGSGKGQFDCPFGVTTDSTGRVYVADSNNHRIQVFTAEGKFLRMFGRWGAGRGELGFPIGVAVDASGLVYVSESNNHRISVLTSEGRFVTSFGGKGNEPGQFDRPCGLALDGNRVVYVCDSSNRCVQIF